MIDYAVLKTELQTDPKALGYAPLIASGSDGALADKLNAKTISGRKPVDVKTLLRWGASSGVLADIVTNSSSAGDKKVRSICIATLKLLERLDTLDLDDAGIRALVDALVTGGVMTAAQKDELLALGNAPVSRTEELFGIGVVVGHEDVAKALRG